MHTYVKALTKVASRYAPSRMLSFELIHVFKVFQLLDQNGRVSRESLGQDLGLGKGTTRTLLKHMKMQGLVQSTNGGTRLTHKGRTISSELFRYIPRESAVPRCSIALGKYNYAVLLREFGFAVKSGIEQRDAAIRMGAIGATTLLYKNQQFLMPGKISNSLSNEIDIAILLVNNLRPTDGDVVIIGSDSNNKKTAELAAKSAALATIMNHERHHHL